METKKYEICLNGTEEITKIPIMLTEDEAKVIKKLEQITDGIDQLYKTTIEIKGVEEFKAEYSYDCSIQSVGEPKGDEWCTCTDEIEQCSHCQEVRHGV